MATAAEIERLIILEVKVSSIEDNVTEIKGDLKTVLINQQQLAVNLATKEAAENAVSSARNTASIWMRFVSERVIALIAIAVAVYTYLKG